MILTRDLFLIVALSTFFALSINPKPIEAGITSYLPPISILNPLSWFYTTRTRNATSDVSKDNISRSDSSNGRLIHEVKLEGPKEQALRFATIKPNRGKTHMTTLTTTPALTTTTTTTTTTPIPSTTVSQLDASISTNVSNYQPGSIANLFTTQRPKIIVPTNKYSAMKVRISKNGKFYDSSVNANLSRQSSSYAQAFEINDDRKSPSSYKSDRDIDSINPRSLDQNSRAKSEMNYETTANSTKMSNLNIVGSIWKWITNGTRTDMM